MCDEIIIIIIILSCKYIQIQSHPSYKTNYCCYRNHKECLNIFSLENRFDSLILGKHTHDDLQSVLLDIVTNGSQSPNYTPKNSKNFFEN